MLIQGEASARGWNRKGGCRIKRRWGVEWKESVRREFKRIEVVSLPGGALLVGQT